MIFWLQLTSFDLFCPQATIFARGFSFLAFEIASLDFISARLVTVQVLTM